MKKYSTTLLNGFILGISTMLFIGAKSQDKNLGDITIIADGTSCRCQIKDGLNREAIHIAKFLDQNIIY